jgi:hypothetical protein
MFEELKAVIFKLYPGSEYERRWTTTDMGNLLQNNFMLGYSMLLL